MVSEDKQNIISSAFCPHEQGHPKELKSELSIPGNLYVEFIQRLDCAYNDDLSDNLVIPAVEEIENAPPPPSPEPAEEKKEEGSEKADSEKPDSEKSESEKAESEKAESEKAESEKAESEKE